MDEVTLQDAAQLLDLDATAVRRLCDEGAIAVRRLPGNLHRRLVLADVLALKAERDRRREGAARIRFVLEDSEGVVPSRTKWAAVERADSDATRAAAEDEARISQFRELVFRLRTEAGLTQVELAHRMGTTQSAIARMEGGGAKPSLETLERLAAAVGKDATMPDDA